MNSRALSNAISSGRSYMVSGNHSHGSLFPSYDWTKTRSPIILSRRSLLGNAAQSSNRACSRPIRTVPDAFKEFIRATASAPPIASRCRANTVCRSTPLAEPVTPTTSANKKNTPLKLLTASTRNSGQKVNCKPVAPRRALIQKIPKTMKSQIIKNLLLSFALITLPSAFAKKGIRYPNPGRRRHPYHRPLR